MSKLEEELVKSFVEVIINVDAFGCPVRWLVYLWVVVRVVWWFTHIVFNVGIAPEAGDYPFDIFCCGVFGGDKFEAEAE